METPITRALQGLQMNMPVANQQIANQRKAASTIAMQQLGNQAIKQPMPAAQAATAIAAPVAQQAGQQQIQQAANTAQTVNQIAQVNQQEVATANAANTTTQQRSIQDTQFRGEQALARLSESAKRELFDERMKLITEQNTNKFLNEKHLLDLALLKGVNDEKFRDYQQTLEQATQRKLQIMEMAYKRIEMEMEQAHNRGEQELEQELKQKLTELKAASDLESRKRANRGAAWGAVIQGVLTIGGALAGSVLGPAGAAAGGQAGSAVGGVAASQITK